MFNNCSDCIHNHSGVCKHEMSFISSDWEGHKHNCYMFSKKQSINAIIKKHLKLMFKIVKAFIISVIFGAIVFGFCCWRYNWTKQSLEDLSGKEVKPSTVIWTMFNVKR